MNDITDQVDKTFSGSIVWAPLHSMVIIFDKNDDVMDSLPLKENTQDEAVRTSTIHMNKTMRNKTINGY